MKFSLGDIIQKKNPQWFDHKMHVCRIGKGYYLCSVIGKFSSWTIDVGDEDKYDILGHEDIQPETEKKGVKFRIRRVSGNYYKSEKPCEGAYLDEVVKDENDSEYDKNCWAIDIDTLEDLIKLAEKEGQLIISAGCPESNDLPDIEIYDTWRE